MVDQIRSDDMIYIYIFSQLRIQIQILKLYKPLHLLPHMSPVNDYILVPVYSLNQTILAGLEEKRDTEPPHRPRVHVTATTVLQPRRPHPMHSSHEPPPGYLGHEIPDIHNHRVGNIRRRDPVSVCVFDFQSTGSVLVEEREDTRVGMRRTAEFWLRVGDRLWSRVGLDDRVMEETEGAERVLEVGGEEIRWFV